jgi:tetratricopeptide (TPR) repeat protein
MKRNLFIFIAFVFPFLSFGSDSVNAAFVKGNASYNKAQYKEAINTYQNILNAGYQSAALYFNMGNASYKLGDIAPAVLFYEKAHKLAPADADINFNIRYTNSKTIDKIDPAPEFFLTKWWRAFLLSYSIQTFATISIIVMLFSSGIFIIYLFTNSVSLKKISFYTSLISFCAGLFIVFMASQQTAYFNSRQQAIIFSGTVNVKSGPGDGMRTLFTIHEGAKVNVLDKTNGWLKIDLVNGNVGWIRCADAREI